MRLSDLLNTEQSASTRQVSPPLPDPSSSRAGSESLPDDELEDDELPSFTNNRKRRRIEDFSQHVMASARSVKLKKSDEDKVFEFSKLSSPEQRISIYAQNVATLALLQTLGMPEAAYEIPTTLDGYIEWFCFASLIAPDCARYVAADGPLSVITDVLLKNPRWGLTIEVKNDKKKFGIICRRIRRLLTQRRNLMKTTITTSMGLVRLKGKVQDNGEAQDIVDLAEALIHDGRKVTKRELTISISMLARLAFLRDMRAECLGNQDVSDDDYWLQVDARLKEYRDQKLTPAALTSKFVAILKKDVQKYGGADRADNIDDPAFSLADVD